jgi:hypothetical protein
MDPVIVEVIDGAFAGFEGEVVSMDGDKVSVRGSVFGRETPAVLRRDQLADSDDADHGQATRRSRGCGNGSPSSTSD